MQSRTLTTINQLKVGDRFYVPKKTTREVFEIIHHQVTKTQYQTYKHWAVSAAVVDNPRFDDAAKARLARAFKGETEVVYLRNVNQTIN